MRKHEGRWQDVKAEDYVVDKNGKLWRVDRWDHVAARITDKDGQTATVRPGPLTEVTYYRRTMTDAVKTVEKILGGVVIEEIRTET